jgi:phage baseplate assembly protein W
MKTSLAIFFAAILFSCIASAEMCGTSLKDLKIICGTEYINQSMFLFLNTKPGERVERPDYGFDFSKYSDLHSSESQAELVRDVTRAMEENFENIVIVSVDVGSADGPSPEYLLNITYQLTNGSTQQFTFEVPDAGGF